jgi:hypothetical protein
VHCVVSNQGYEGVVDEECVVALVEVAFAARENLQTRVKRTLTQNLKEEEKRRIEEKKTGEEERRRREGNEQGKGKRKEVEKVKEEVGKMKKIRRE